MKKVFMILLVLALVLASLTACGGGSDEGVEAVALDPDQVYELRLSCPNNTTHFVCINAQMFADEVRELTDGKVDITVYPSNELGDYYQVYDELMMGTIDFAWQTISDAYDVRSSLYEMPYLCTTWDDVNELYISPAGWFYQEMADLNDSLGVKMLGIIPNGFMGVAGKNLGDEALLFDPLAKKSALVRTNSSLGMIETTKALGFNTVTIDYSDLYSALQTGTADGWNGGSLVSNWSGFKDVIDVFVEYNCTHEAKFMLCSQKTFDKLPAEYQQIIVDTGAKYAEYSFEQSKTAQDEARTGLEDYGVKILTLTDEQLTAYRDHVRTTVWPLFEEKYGEELMQKLYDFAGL